MALQEIKKYFFILGPVEAACDKKIRGLCSFPYDKHPRGCPNLGKKKGCPPYTKLFSIRFDSYVLIAAVEFDFSSFLKYRKALHSSWSERALRNQRHWQGHLRSFLKKNIAEELSRYEGYVPVFNPEAMGVNVTETCRIAGIILEWPPQERVYEIALLAKPKVL